jgi:hypothetical protein
MVIINDPKIAFDLLRDRSTIHSSRPHQVFAGDLYVTSTMSEHLIGRVPDIN